MLVSTINLNHVSPLKFMGANKVICGQRKFNTVNIKSYSTYKCTVSIHLSIYWLCTNLQTSILGKISVEIPLRKLHREVLS